MPVRAVGFVKSCSVPSGSPEGFVEFVLEYCVSENIQGPIIGEAAVLVDIAQNDAQITQGLRQGLADHINNTAVVSPNLATNDVRGCNV